MGLKEGVLTKADAVYFLMWNGWKQELKSNRWHYASRWARHLPVILVQPSQIGTSAPRSEQETRIPNCKILYIKDSNHENTYLSDTFIQFGQVMTDMQQNGIMRPLLWCYNPRLVGLFASLPAWGRFYHATENHFHFPDWSDFSYEQLKTSIRISDVVVAVSEGVAQSIRENVPGSNVSVVTNGCDYRSYSNFSPDTMLASTRGGYTRIAVYAGNINSRLDFELLRRCTREFPDTLFAFYGPVTGLTNSDLMQWKVMLAAKNVSYPGSVDADQLPDIYGAADVGIIPYKTERWIVENGFPLKALEMCATSLPVVSTFMKPMLGLATGVCVAQSHDHFVAALKATSRQALSDADREELRRICQQNDYDAKFDHVVNLITTTIPDNATQSTRLDNLIGGLLCKQWIYFGRLYWESRYSFMRRIKLEQIIKLERRIKPERRIKLEQSIKLEQRIKLERRIKLEQSIKLERYIKRALFNMFRKFYSCFPVRVRYLIPNQIRETVKSWFMP